MLPFILSKASLLLFLFSILLDMDGQSIAQPLYQICGDQGNYTANSTFQTNLNLLLRSLTSKASVTGFYNATTGDIPERVYGLVLCRGDVSPNACKKCVEIASEDILQLCPYRKVAYVWYDYCFLRYSILRFFSRTEESPKFYMWNTQKISNPKKFSQLLEVKLNDLSSQAALRSNRLFATGEANFTSSKRLYALVQCTRDTSRTDCSTCLQNSISEIPTSPLDGKRGGRIIGPSCNFRYEIYSFYNATPSGPASPPPP